MSDTFQLNPHVECIRISGAEFLIRGGHLEGYSLIVEDDGDGIAEAILAADRAPVSVETIARQVDDGPAVQRILQPAGNRYERRTVHERGEDLRAK